MTKVNIDEIILPDKLKRKLNVSKIQMLSGSMRLIGLKHPVTVTTEKLLLAGNHRVAAARSLGWTEIEADIVPVDAILNELVTIDENLLRHDLTVLEQGEHMKRRNDLMIALGQRAVAGNKGEERERIEVDMKCARKRGDRKIPIAKAVKPTTADIAHDMGMSARTMQERIQIADKIDEEVRLLIHDMPIADNKIELLRLASLTVEEQKRVAAKIADGSIKTVKEGASVAKRETQRAEFEKLSDETKRLPDTMLLVNKDFFDYEDTISDNSIDLIVTDPPYIDDWKSNITPFMRVANRVLKPGGALVMVIGHVRLPEVFEGFTDCKNTFGDNALKFYHICALAHSGHLAAMHHVGAMNGFKPIVIAMKPPIHKPYKMYNDLIEGSGRDKSIHDWQQSVEEILPLMDAFSKPGDTILDPFMGAGTYGVAAKMTIHKFIGVEMDKNTYKDAHRNILQADK